MSYFYKSACDRSWNQNLSLHTKFHWNRMIPGWDIAIKPFTKWRPSAILNFQNLVFWSRDLCLNVILLLHTKFRVNRTINRGDIAKRRFFFNMAAVRHFEFAIFWYFVIPRILSHHASNSVMGYLLSYFSVMTFNMCFKCVLILVFFRSPQNWPWLSCAIWR